MVRRIEVIKVPRQDAIKDKIVSFPPFNNLHLELVEIKRKLKPSLPPITIVPRKPLPKELPPTPEQFSEAKLKEQNDDTSQPSTPRKEKDSPAVEESSTRKTKEKEIERDEASSDRGDEDLVAALGEKESEDDKDEDEDKDEEKDEPKEEKEEVANDDPYAGLSPEERERKEKEEYIWRWRILKKQYKEADLPEYNEHSDLYEMKTTYERKIRELSLEDSVTTYRGYLIGGFMITEFICTQWLQLDFTGFTTLQTTPAMMTKYDRLLIELGERSYSHWSMNLPVEVRLIGLIIIQAGIFYLGKIICANGGGTIAELFKAITGMPPDTRSSSTDEPPKKKKMRGPSIKPEDIKGMANEDKGSDGMRSRSRVSVEEQD